jgi:hypothetical protein
MTSSSDVAFSQRVKAVQERRGSRAAFARMEAKGGFATAIDPSLAEFIAGMRSFYLATASKDGQQAALPVSCTSSTRRPSPSPISPATGNTSPPAIWQRTRRR